MEVWIELHTYTQSAKEVIDEVKYTIMWKSDQFFVRPIDAEWCLLTVASHRSKHHNLDWMSFMFGPALYGFSSFF